MKTLLLSLLPLLASTLCAAPVALNLRYEWAPALSGPWTAVPADSLKVHADGTATALSEAARMFFRLQIGEGSAAGGATTPVLPLVALPEPLLIHVKDMLRAAGEEGHGEGGADWKDVEPAPFAIPVTSPWSRDGQPDMAEVKIVGVRPAARPGAVFPDGEGTPPPRDRGFILVSLTRGDFPVQSYSTEGLTPAEELLARCPGRAVARVTRFGPAFLVAEDERGQPVANAGLQPLLVTDESYEGMARRVSWEWSSDNEVNPRLPVDPHPPVALTWSSYDDLKRKFTESPWRQARRAQRAALAEYDWLALEGRSPKLTVKLGEEARFFPGTIFTSWAVDQEDERAVPVGVTLTSEGGVVLRGFVAGAWRLTLMANGVPQRWLVVVRPAGPLPRGGEEHTVKCTTWAAGNWNTQPKYDQRLDLDRWCDAVGCGPTAMAIQIAWMEHYQNVPSAYFSKHPQASAITRKYSAGVVDAPLRFVTNKDSDPHMIYWYDWLHDLCDVHCFPSSDSGATYPHDMAEAFEEYVSYVCGSAYPNSLGIGTAQLVGANLHCEWDIISDDWDESGIRLAEKNKAGRPGVAFYMELMHYVVAYGYRRTDHVIKCDGEVVEKYSDRAFRCNMGWGEGSSSRQWLNAYDIDGCYLLDLTQKRPVF